MKFLLYRVQLIAIGEIEQKFHKRSAEVLRSASVLILYFSWKEEGKVYI